MDTWILGVLILILIELGRIESRLGKMAESGGFSEKLLGELKELREELLWFKDDNFAGHLFKQIDGISTEVGSSITTELSQLGVISSQLDSISTQIDSLTTAIEK